MPADLQPTARDAFQNGSSYFVWLEMPQPLRFTEGQTIEVPLKYEAADGAEPPPFVTVMELSGIKVGSDVASVTATWSGRSKDNDGKDAWRAVGRKPMFSETLTGEGNAVLYLIKEDDQNNPAPVPISNRVTVRIVIQPGRG